MGNVYYDPGAARAEKVRGLFARIAQRYDLINDVQSFGMHRSWKRKVAALADLQPGQKALDVCCGTGDLVFVLARSQAEVTGLDFSEQMLQVARKRQRLLQAKGKGAHTHFVLGDAQNLPFPDASFNVVTVGYGLRNLADWQRGLLELHRVLLPGGRLLVLDFGKPDNSLWRGIYFTYLRFFVPVLGLAVAGSASAYAYILESLRHYPAQRGVAQQMRGLGMRSVEIKNFLGGAMTINSGVKA